MDRLKQSPPEQPLAPQESGDAGHPVDCPGCADCDAMLAAELIIARTVLEEGEPTGRVDPPVSASPREPPAPLPRGASVGRYLVLERLGAGGMSEVYAAFDPHLNRRVALKLLLPDAEGLEPEEARLRLLREAQAMARLSSPNVLPVFELGEHGERIFIVLELVEGSTLRQWLKARPRSWREVVQVLSAAGRGLAAAHAAGLVHRDFKPDNVLVGQDGRVLVFDFGIAVEHGTGDSGTPSTAAEIAELLRDRPRGESSTPRTVEPLETPLTRAGRIMGTPGYMAPEQYRREPATAQADQFSFCATLYYALYGEHAFEGRGASALARSTLEGQLRPAPRGSRVPGWLRAVVLQGLRQKPEERHPSMEALLAALNPRMRRRHWLLGAAAAALVVAVGAGAVHAWQQRQLLCQGAARRLEGVWDEARQQAMERAFLATGQPYAADAWAGVKATLDGYARGWVAQQTQACEATRLRGVSSEEELVARTRCLERRRVELRALTDVLLEARARTVERSVEAVRGLSEPGTCAHALSGDVPTPADPKLAREVEDLRATLARAHALRSSGRYADGLAVAAPAATQARSLGYRPLEAEALLELGRLLASFGQPEAEHTLEQAAWTADEVGLDALRAEALVALTSFVAHDAARAEEGHERFHQARAVLGRLHTRGRLLAGLESAHGLVFAGQGDAAAAEASQRNALAALEREAAADSPEVAMVLRRLGNTLSAQGRHEEALAMYQHAHAAFQKALGAEHPRTASSLVNLGGELSRLGRHEEAFGPLRQGLEVVERTLAACHPFRAVALESLGTALSRTGRTEEALVELRRAVVAAEQARGPEHLDVALPATTLGTVLVEAGRPAEALAPLERALRLREQTLGNSHPDLAETRFALARALWESGGDRARALRLAQQAETVTGGPGTEALRSRVQAWLSERAPRG